MSDWDTIYLDAMHERERGAHDTAVSVSDEMATGEWVCPECSNLGEHGEGCALCGVINGED